MLFVHRSERADLLVGMLAELLRVPASDPMAQEVVAVPTRGIERWLTQQLSHTLGAGPDRRGRDLRERRLPVSGHPGLLGPRRRVGHRRGVGPLGGRQVGVAPLGGDRFVPGGTLAPTSGSAFAQRCAGGRAEELRERPPHR